MKLAGRLRRWLLIAAALLLLFTLTGFFLLPVILKSQIEKRLSAELGRGVTVGKVRTNPYALSLTLENFAIREQDGAATFLGWRRLYVNFDAFSSLWKEWVLGEIALDGFDARVAIKADGAMNFSDLLARVASQNKAPAPAPAGKGKPPRPVRVASLKVADSRVDFSDASRPKPFATQLGPVTFTLTGFRTVSAPGAPYRFEAVSESGEKFAWAGTLQAEPLRSVGELKLENIVLAKYAPYLPDQVQADLAGGTLSVRGRYEINLTEGQRVLTLSDGAVELRGLKLLERASQENVFELPALAIHGVRADALAQKAVVDSVVLTGGNIRVRREKDGSINLLSMLRPPAAAPTVPAGPASPPAAASAALRPDVMIGEVVLKDFQIALSDLAAPRPVQLALDGFQFSLRNVTLAEGAAMPLQLAFTFAPRGTVRLEGSVAIAPVKADLKIDVAALEILPLSPYLEQFANVRITQGAVTTALHAQVALPRAEPLAASVTGDVNVKKLGLVDSAHNEELAGFGSLSLRGLRATTAPGLSIALDEVDVAAPFARVIIHKDKSLNLVSIVPAGAASQDAPATPAAANGPAAADTPPVTPAPPPKIGIGKVVISDGDYRFTDRSVEPNVTMAINQFGGTIAGLSSVNPAKADLDLKATVDGAGAVAITGKVDPLGATRWFDLKVDFKNVDLVPLSSYSGKYAGYELARGKLLLDVKFRMDGNKIDAANLITLKQFTFGGAVKSPEATSLPVRLGVALLKDMDGNIVIDVPVQGSTDDPSFGVGRVVMRVIVNLLTKAAVSPFALLGAAFGGGGDELAFQEFAPGSSEIQAGEMQKLQTMVQALTNRPALSLALQGSFDAAADAYALKRIKLADTVRRAIWDAKRRSDPNIAPPDQFVATPEEIAARIKQLYDEKFPPGTEFGAPLPKPPAVVTPPPPPPGGFFKRMLNAVSLQSKRQQRIAEAENARLSADHAQVVAAAIATGLPIEEMSGRLAETVTVDDNDLRALAQARAQRVRDHFGEVGKISAERLFLSKDQADAAKAGQGPRVFLSLQ